MKLSCSLIIGIILMFSFELYSANLEKSHDVNNFLASTASKVVPKTANLSTPGILGTDLVTERPVLYKVNKAVYSKARLVGLASIAGIQVDGNVSVT